MKGMKFIQFMQKRPTDKTILVGRIIFGLVFIALMAYNLIYLNNKAIDDVYLNFSFFGWELTPGLRMDANEIMIFKYILTGLGIIPIFMGITNLCMFKKKYVRFAQIFFGILLFYIAGIIKDSASLDFDFIIGFMGLLPLFAGITGKCITKKCIKYGEKIIKIRV